MKNKVIPFLVVLAMVVSFVAKPMSAEAAEIDSKAGKVTVSYGWLNVRSGASSGSSIITTLKKDTYVTLVSKSDSWWKIEYDDGKYGYCHSDYIAEVSSNARTVSLTSGTLNVRSGAGTTYERIGSVKNGNTVLVLSEVNGWSNILYNGIKTGYVKSSYLSSGVKYASVSLNVPSFKQTDSRWANVKLGSSGKTISQIGCATTALAMTESYRTGTVIYPNDMAKKLKYTSSGSLYWPENYYIVSSISGYMSKIYNLLKSGKPVLIGLKKSSGAQHWVVVTGYLGGDTLKASSFTVNDPGSKTRTTLQQLINEYPYFYKYLYY